VRVRAAAPTRRRSSAPPAVRCTAEASSLRRLAKQYDRAPETARIAARTAGYCIGIGAALMVAPLTCLLGLVGHAVVLPSPIWGRSLGILVCLLGFVYAGAALDDCAGRPPYAFYSAAFWGRVFLSYALYAIAWTDAALKPFLVIGMLNGFASDSLQSAAIRRTRSQAAAPPPAAAPQMPVGGSSGSIQLLDKFYTHPIL
jgi:hypothetical protein